jgi:hypothetical protein
LIFNDFVAVKGGATAGDDMLVDKVIVTDRD